MRRKKKGPGSLEGENRWEGLSGSQFLPVIKERSDYLRFLITLMLCDQMFSATLKQV